MLEVSLVGVGAVLRLERDAWSMVKRLRQATCEYAPRLVTEGRLCTSKGGGGVLSSLCMAVVVWP